MNIKLPLDGGVRKIKKNSSILVKMTKYRTKNNCL